MANKAIVLSAQERKNFGKGASRQARRDGLVPGVVYGHGADPLHILLPAHETALALRGNDNALIKLDVDGEEYLVLSKAVQRHPIRPGVQHVDFVLVNRNEKVEVEIAVTTVGEVIAGASAMIEATTILASAPAISIPENIEVDVTGIEAGSAIRVEELTFPEGVEAIVDGETVVVNIVDESAMITAEDLESDAEVESEEASEEESAE
ncbi:50S ribosomal protein L25/general stress protein Ctc [Actinomyces vulturis]|uniref:50S ribosomal protein L25/general stress protein Ctc n=1 Tax=Actinomyces vulturis TaxID=1857645 RepID=UPI00082E51D8|nr:50S ribosomal protein L25/general stress protein Ctc [Actinomyces vulturis]